MSEGNKAAINDAEIDSFVQEFRKVRKLYEEFTEELHQLLCRLVENENILLQTSERRCKSIDSFQVKLRKPEKEYKSPLHDITDLVGVRLVALHSEDKEKVCEIIRREFDVDNDNSVDKRESYNPSEFGYTSTHIVVELDSSRGRVSEWRKYEGIKAEIQVRTVLEHAWASIEYALLYKPDFNVPKSIERRLYRIKAVVELCEDEFASIISDSKEMEEIRAGYGASIETGQLGVQLDELSLLEYLKDSDFARTREFVQYAIDSGWSPWPMEQAMRILDESHQDSKGTARMGLEEILERQIVTNAPVVFGVGIESVADLDQLVGDLEVEKVIQVLFEICEMCKLCGVWPFAGPVDPLAIMVLYSRTEVSDRHLLYELDWMPIGKAATDCVLYGECDMLEDFWPRS